MQSVVIFSVCLAVAAAQSFSLGKCPSVSTMDSFDIRSVSSLFILSLSLSLSLSHIKMKFDSIYAKLKIHTTCIVR